MLICDFHRGATKPTWLPGTIVQLDGGQNYKVQLPDDQIVRRHADHIRVRDSACEDVALNEETDDVLPIPVTKELSTTRASPPIELRHSQRIRKPPECFPT